MKQLLGQAQADISINELLASFSASSAASPIPLRTHIAQQPQINSFVPTDNYRWSSYDQNHYPTDTNHTLTGKMTEVIWSASLPTIIRASVLSRCRIGGPRITDSNPYTRINSDLLLSNTDVCASDNECAVTDSSSEFNTNDKDLSDKNQDLSGEDDENGPQGCGHSSSTSDTSNRCEMNTGVGDVPGCETHDLGGRQGH
ncbi:hypothetical protein AJ78_06777 [Emergomyces pasteurianus Ep9510]|uniref:Uncharacterized protein n=1 Tax=Emergomyces pasteurianus Ep9510 TaxID=1447872 RepID=A0A1J9P891_9EURO|nr:hypothetical protein AJ78_06777 [Emergomyces pasteurianus Ep9510]